MSDAAKTYERIITEQAAEIERLRAENEAMRAKAEWIIETARCEVDRGRGCAGSALAVGSAATANEWLARSRGAERILAAGRKAVEG